MFGSVGRKLVEGVVGLFALLGFIYVPLGRHTGLEHAQMVLSTPAAKGAIEDLTTTALRLRSQALGYITGRVSPPAASERESGSTGDDRKTNGAAQPRPVPPKLN